MSKRNRAADILAIDELLKRSPEEYDRAIAVIGAFIGSDVRTAWIKALVFTMASARMAGVNIAALTRGANGKSAPFDRGALLRFALGQFKSGLLTKGS